MRLKRHLFSFFCASSYLSNTPQQGFLTPPYPQCSTADSQQCASNNTQSGSLFSPKLMRHLQTLQSYFHLGVYVFLPRAVCCWAWAGAGERRWFMCVWWRLRLLLCRSGSSSRSPWTLMDKINRTHVAQAVCLLGFRKSKASVSLKSSRHEGLFCKHMIYWSSH